MWNDHTSFDWGWWNQWFCEKNWPSVFTEHFKSQIVAKHWVGKKEAKTKSELSEKQTKIRARHKKMQFWFSKWKPQTKWRSIIWQTCMTRIKVKFSLLLGKKKIATKSLTSNHIEPYFFNHLFSLMEPLLENLSI